MVDLELVKKILFEHGVASIDRMRLKLARKVLTNEGDIDLIRKVFSCEDFGVEVDRARLCDFLNYYGVNNIYVGERVNYYSNGELKLRNIRGKSLLPEIDLTGKRSLFKHDEYDYYYYDLLDDGRQCEHIKPDIFYIRDGCDNMKSMATILNKQNKECKERIK